MSSDSCYHSSIFSVKCQLPLLVTVLCGWHSCTATIFAMMASTLFPYFCPTQTFRFVLPAVAFATHCVYSLQVSKSFLNLHLSLGILNYGVVWVTGLLGPCRCCLVLSFICISVFVF
jgi:hypothetical protein